MKYIYIILLSTFLCNVTQAQISGKIYRDYNGDGLQQVNEPDVPGVVINAFDKNNVIINTATSSLNGNYSLPFIDTVRLEFEIQPNTACFTLLKDYFSMMPTGENIRFINAPTTNVNLSIHTPANYVINANPDVFVTRINEGDPLVPGISATETAIFGHPHASAGNATTTFVSPHQLPAAQIGSVWGMAYSKHAKKIFCSAFLKRFCGLGSMGTGGIYLLEPSGATFNVTNFYDMDANGHRTRAAASAVPYGLGNSYTINTTGTQATYLGPIDPVSGLPEGVGVIGANGAGGRGLTTGISGTWLDPSAMDQVCKVGIGDVDISDDGRFLFLTNLYDRKIYRLELDNVMNPQSVVAVTSYALPNIPVNNGLLRGFALCNHFGKMYIGAVSTGEFGGQCVLNGPTDVYAYVFEMNNPLGNATINPVPVFSLPLNYEKGYSGLGSNIITKQWHAWNGITSSVPGVGESAYPTPVLSDIEFTQQGDLILNFMDRSSHQFSYGGKKNLTGTTNVSYVSGGDIRIAGIDCTTGNFTIESNAGYVSNGLAHNNPGGLNNNSGIEFFNDKGEFEGSLGSLAMMPFKDTFIATLMNPAQILTNGTVFFNVLNGISSNALILANSQQSGKNNSMGDIELAGDAPLIQLGNRVWNDINVNGIQDANEPGINNVGVEIFADFNQDNVPDGPALGSSITSGNGSYAFDKTNVADGDPVTPGAQLGPVAYRKYLIRIANSDWVSGAGANDLQNFFITLQHVGGAGQPDVRDNDASLLSTIPTISVFTDMNGANDHSQDFGFNQCENLILDDVTLTCDSMILQIGPDLDSLGNTFSWNPPTGLSDINIAQPFANPTSATTYTLTINNTCTYTATVLIDQEPPKADAGDPKYIDCSTKSTIIGTPSVTGLTYHWEPTTGLDNPNIAQPTATPTVTTTYTLTVTGKNGCSSPSTTKVTVDLCCTKITVPNCFSPNNDDLNDTWGIIEIQNLRAFDLSVYNRWGQKLFGAVNKNLRWDGKYKGKDCDMGTYFYLIKYDCDSGKEPLILKGDFTLIR